MVLLCFINTTRQHSYRSLLVYHPMTYVSILDSSKINVMVTMLTARFRCFGNRIFKGVL